METASQEVPESRRDKSWEVTLTKLRVVDPQEDRSLIGVPLSDGDEPYLLVFGVRSVFGNSGSTSVQRNEYDNDDWAGHLREGQQKNIPVSMGSMRFQNVGRNSVIALVVIAFESDRTPWAIMRNRVATVSDALQSAVAQSVETRSAANLERTAFIEDLHRIMQDAVSSFWRPPDARQALENVIFSGVDTDEVIGVNTAIWMLNPPSSTMAYPHYRPPFLTDQLTNRDYVFNRNALVFQDNRLRARYDVEMRVREY